MFTNLKFGEGSGIAAGLNSTMGERSKVFVKQDIGNERRKRAGDWEKGRCSSLNARQRWSGNERGGKTQAGCRDWFIGLHPRFFVIRAPSPGWGRGPLVGGAGHCHGTRSLNNACQWVSKIITASAQRMRREAAKGQQRSMRFWLQSDGNAVRDWHSGPRAKARGR